MSELEVFGHTCVPPTVHEPRTSNHCNASGVCIISSIRAANPDRHFVFRRHPLCPAVINRDMYGLKSDPRSGFFLFEKLTVRSGADIRTCKTHGLLRSGFSALTMTRIGAERIIRTNLLSRIRTDLPEIVTERIGSDRISARGKCHGLSGSGYPPSKYSRIFAERISVKRIFHGADYLTPSNKPHTPWDYPRCTGATIR